MRVRRGLKYIAAVVLTVGIYLCTTVIMDGYHIYGNAVAEVSLEDRVASIRGKENYITYHELPEIHVDTVLLVGDHRFYNHPGIDMIAIGQVVFNGIRAGAFVESRSTMAQQLAENMYFIREKGLQHRAAEVFATFDLERNYSENEILELYVNAIYHRNGYYCVKDASRRCFGKEPGDMTDYESTLLAGVSNAPSKYAPTVSQELAGKHQKQVLARLVKCGYFTEERALETLAARNTL